MIIQNRRQALQPNRVEYAKKELAKRKIEIIFEDETTLQFEFNGNKINFYPFTGWFSGKGIEDGRGIRKLLKQLKKNE